MWRNWFAILLIVGMVSATSFSQSYPDVEQGIHPFGSYDASSIDSVNLQNGGLVVKIPLFSYPERGKFGATVELIANGKQWHVTEHCDQFSGSCSGTWQILNNFSGGAPSAYPNPIGMGLAIDDGVPHYEPVYSEGQLPNGKFVPNMISYYAFNVDGSSHQIYGGPNAQSTGSTIDGSGIAFSSSGVLTSRSGVSSAQTVNTPVYLHIEDPNGNIEHDSAGDDSLGRPGLYSAFQNAQTITDSSGCRGPLAIAGIKLVTFPGPNGSTRQLKLCSVAAVGQTEFNALFNDPGNPGDFSPITEATVASNVLQSAVLYNGIDWNSSPAWTFEYNNNASGSGVENYADLTKITFPTGGTISYVWWTNSNSSDCGFATKSRWVQTRTANANDGSPAEVNTYSGNYAQTTVTDAQGNYITHSFSSVGSSGGCNLFETGTTWYDKATNRIVRTVQTDYSGMYFPFDPESNSPPNLSVNVLPIRTTTTLANGMVSKVEKDYDSGVAITYWDPYTVVYDSYGQIIGYGADQTAGGFSRGLMSQKREYAYGSGAPGPLIRCTQYTYAALQNSQYLAKNILDLPTQVSVYAGACGTGTLVSQTTNGYDETTLQSSGVTTQLDGTVANPGIRGNLTSVHKWLNTGGTISTSTKYYDTGMPYQSTDGDGNTTTYNYSSAYAGGLLTETDMPTTGTIQHIIGAGYDPNTGLMTSYTDQNSNTTSFAYDDLSRMISASFPDQGLTTLSYPDFNTVVETVLDGKTTTTKFDGLGRKSHLIVNDSPQNDTVDYTYDWMGRLASVSNPYRSTGESTYGITSFTYDALNRKTVQTQPDGSTLQWVYNGNVTDNYDETNRHWQRTTDVFGNLIQVKEPDASNNPTIETDYQYNTLNDLTRIDQWGGPSGSSGDRVRTFTYDSLSRLLSATNPESGTTGYTYDNNGNMHTKTDARGIASTYGYDGLNRPTGVSFSDGVTPGYAFYYDVPPTWMNDLQNVVGRLANSTQTGPNAKSTARAYSYDSMGRIIREWEQTPSVAPGGFFVSATYDHAGDLKTLTYPDGRLVTNTYDGTQHLTNVQYTNWNGTSVNYNYLATATYEPNGSPYSLTYGNGAVETETWNKRLQPVNVIAQTNFDGIQANIYDKNYCYGPADSVDCGNLGVADNGNILRVLDLFTNNHSQGFNYDNMNRLIAFNTGDNTMVQSFGYDNWGNMTQSGTQAFQVNYDGNNRISATGFNYDADGNLTGTNYGVQQNFTYDALNQITGYDSGGATYTYDAVGQRVRKDIPGNWTEYIYFNKTPLTEKNSDGSWSDYIYANGKRIARADSYDERLHTHGTCASTCVVSFQLPAGQGYTIRTGDKLYWRQYQSGGNGGPYFYFQDNTQTAWNWNDSNGVSVNGMIVQGQWAYRSADMSGFAGKVIKGAYLMGDPGTTPATWDIWYGEVSIVSADGTVFPLYNRQPGVTLPVAYNQGNIGTSLSAVAEKSNTAGDSEYALATTSYYLSDQINSTRMQLAAGGWPVSMDVYYPYGVEPNPPADTNHYKFTGKERDSESGLDYFGARYYGSTMGRFMSPDPLNLTEERLLHPGTTLNKYAYAADNPLKFVDPDGEDVTYFYDQGGIAGHAVLFAYNQDTGDSAIESFGPVVHAPIAPGESMFDMSSLHSADDVRSTYASLTIQTSPELAQQVIAYIRAHPDPSTWTAFGPNCSTQCLKILQKFKLANKKASGLRPKLLWNSLKQQYNPSAPANPKNGVDYGKPRTDMFNALWLSLPQAPKDNSTVTTSQHDNLPCGGQGDPQCPK